MIRRVARLLVELAALLLGPARCDWGLAMRAELVSAIDEGRGLRFAGGCLFAAVRALPMHPEGRFALATHAAGLCLVPFAASLVCAAVAGHPFAADGRLVLNDGEAALAPALALLAATIAAAQLALAWFVAERDWPRATAAMLFGTATVAALVPLAALLPLDGVAVMRLLAALPVQAATLNVLARWHEDLGAEAYWHSG